MKILVFSVPNCGMTIVVHRRELTKSGTEAKKIIGSTLSFDYLSVTIN